MSRALHVVFHVASLGLPPRGRIVSPRGSVCWRAHARTTCAATFRRARVRRSGAALWAGSRPARGRTGSQGGGAGWGKQNDDCLDDASGAHDRGRRRRGLRPQRRQRRPALRDPPRHRRARLDQLLRAPCRELHGLPPGPPGIRQVGAPGVGAQRARHRGPGGAHARRARSSDGKRRRPRLRWLRRRRARHHGAGAHQQAHPRRRDGREARAGRDLRPVPRQPRGLRAHGLRSRGRLPRRCSARSRTSIS